MYQLLFFLYYLMLHLIVLGQRISTSGSTHDILDDPLQISPLSLRGRSRELAHLSLRGNLAGLRAPRLNPCVYIYNFSSTLHTHIPKVTKGGEAQSSRIYYGWSLISPCPFWPPTPEINIRYRSSGVRDLQIG